MSIFVSDELQLFAQEIQRFLSSNILRDFGFVQRTSKYQAEDLVAPYYYCLNAPIHN